MTGRKTDPVWKFFNKKSDQDKKCLRAKCRACNAEVVGLVARLKAHLDSCPKKYNHEMVDDDEDDLTATRDSASQETTEEVSERHDRLHPPEKKQCKRATLDNFVRKLSAKEKESLDKHVARFFFAANISFLTAENKHFLALMNKACPGYKPPDRHVIADTLLNEEYENLRRTMKEQLKEKTVCMSLDGWSNVHSDPVVCVCISDLASENVFLIDTVETLANRHTSEYLLKIASEAIKKCQLEFGCEVKSFVTDNAANMKKMRQELAGEVEGDILAYGCAAHFLNLLSKDLENATLKSTIKKVAKYFKYKHIPSAKYKELGGSEIPLPIDVRWNSLCQTLEKYLKNWSILISVVSQNRALIDTDIIKIIEDVNLKTDVSNYHEKLQKIGRALDVVQSSKCTISGATHQFYKLQLDFSDSLLFNENERKKFNERFSAAILDFHKVAYMLDPKYRGEHLDQCDEEKAMDYLSVFFPGALPDVLKFKGFQFPFKAYLFDKNITEKLTSYAWWDSQKTHLNISTINLYKQLFMANASTANIERLFSTFGIVHAQLRNRLGVEKSGKLVAVFKALNKP